VFRLRRAAVRRDTTRVHRVADGAYDKVLALPDGH